MNKRRKNSIESFIQAPFVLKQNALQQLRYLLLTEGINDTHALAFRHLIWAILLDVPTLKVANYVDLINKTKCQLGIDDIDTDIDNRVDINKIKNDNRIDINKIKNDNRIDINKIKNDNRIDINKIKNDTFRTLMNNTQFHSKVSESSLIRILAATSISYPYIQGMNVLLAPIAYVCYKSEPTAFAIFGSLLCHIPLYITPDLSGVHTALSLFEIVLNIIDPVLSAFLDSKFLKPKIYAFPSILTLSACTPHLSSVLKLWDFLFAYGFHMNILFVVAQIIINRSKILASPQPMKHLRTFPPLEPEEIIKLSLSFIPELPKDLYDMIVRHASDKNVEEELKYYSIDDY